VGRGRDRRAGQGRAGLVGQRPTAPQRRAGALCGRQLAAVADCSGPSTRRRRRRPARGSPLLMRPPFPRRASLRSMTWSMWAAPPRRSTSWSRRWVPGAAVCVAASWLGFRGAAGLSLEVLCASTRGRVVGFLFAGIPGLPPRSRSHGRACMVLGASEGAARGISGAAASARPPQRRSGRLLPRAAHELPRAPPLRRRRSRRRCGGCGVRRCSSRRACGRSTTRVSPG
jgi:hypothetical protein